MEKKNQNDKSKNIHDILPLDHLIHIILLRVPIRHLARLRCVSKLWCSLISDLDFTEFHFHHSPAATNACFFLNGTMANLVYLDDNDASQKELCLPFKNKLPSSFAVMGSCRGFILLDPYPHFLVIWKPLTGFSKRISYSHIVPCRQDVDFRFIYNTRLHGFGYDASQDDYLVVAAWKDNESQEDHLECLSLKTNSWINLDAALPNPLGVYHRRSRGLFFNGAIHWVPSNIKDYRDAILIFDLKERTFLMISAPEQLPTSSYFYPILALLGGCLALYYHNHDSRNTHIWVMKEYKVQCSWTLYQIPCSIGFRPLCLSSNRDIIGRFCQGLGYFIYNVRGDRLKYFKNLRNPFGGTETVYTESLLPLPSEIKDKDN